MASHFITRFARSVTSVKITTEGQPDEWRDIYRIPAGSLPEMPIGTVLFVHLRKQLESPSDFASDVAVLKEFYIERPDGSLISINRGGQVAGGDQLGDNISRADHYDSRDESCIYIVKTAIPEGCKLAWRIRAKTSTIPGYYLNVWDKGALTVEIRWPDAGDAFTYLP